VNNAWHEAPPDGNSTGETIAFLILKNHAMGENAFKACGKMARANLQLRTIHFMIKQVRNY